MDKEEGFYLLLHSIMKEHGHGPNRLWMAAFGAAVLFIVGVNI
jgi:hypothetical protein